MDTEHTTIETPFGKVLVWSCGRDGGEGVGENTHIGCRTDSREGVGPIIINGVAYRMRVDLWLTPDGSIVMDGWRPKGGGVNLDRDDWASSMKSPSDAARKKANDGLLPILCAFKAENPAFLKRAQIVNLTNRLNMASHARKEAEEALEEALSIETTLAEALDALNAFPRE